MKRDIAKAIEEYRSKFGLLNNSTGAFYPTDVQQILELSEAEGANRQYVIVTNALEAGFIIGCRYQSRQDRKRKKRAK